MEESSGERLSEPLNGDPLSNAPQSTGRGFDSAPLSTPEYPATPGGEVTVETGNAAIARKPNSRPASTAAEDLDAVAPAASEAAAPVSPESGPDPEGGAAGDDVDPDSVVLFERLEHFLEEFRKLGDTPSSLLEDLLFEESEDEDDQNLAEDFDDLQKSLRVLTYYSAVSDEQFREDPAGMPIGSVGQTFGADRSEGPVFVSGRYLLRQLIGRGSYGIVYRAFDMVAQREVALKMPRPELRGIRNVMQRFVHEGTSIGKVVHPGLVPLLDMGQEKEIPYLVTLLVNGPNLEQWLQQSGGAVSLQLTAIWGFQLCEAVDHLHKRSIVHGDLKPSNILLDHPYEEESLELPPEMFAIRVTDFGNASSTRESDSSPAEVVQGTLCFMAPEQLAPTVRTDARSDVYAICAILYEMIAGRPVFESTESRSLETAIRHSLPVPLRAIRSETPYALQSIVMKGLSKDPQDRYANAGELARDLKAWMDLRTPEVLRRHKHRQFGLFVRRNRDVVSVISASVLIVSLIVLARFYESKMDARIAQRRERDAWWSSYVDEIGVASRYLKTNYLKQVRETLDSLSRWPEKLDRKDDPREFAWHHLKEMSRDRSRFVEGIPSSSKQMCMAVDPLGKRVYVGGTDGHLRVIDSDTDRVVADHEIQPAPIQSMAVAPDGLTLAVSDPKGTIRLIDTGTFYVVDTFPLHSDEITGMVFSPDANFLISTGMDGLLAKFSIRDRSVRKSGMGSNFSVQLGYSLNGLVLLPEEKRIVVAQSNNRIRVHDLESGEVLRTMTGHFGEVHQVGVSGNGKWIVSTGSDRTLAFWDRVSPTLVNQVEVGSKFNYVKKPSAGDSKSSRVRGFATMTDSEGLDMVAIDVDDGHIKIFEIPSGAEIAQLVGNDSSLLSMSWSPQARKLYAATADGPVRVWQAPFFEQSIHSDSFELGQGPDGAETAYFIDVDHDDSTTWAGGQHVRCVRYDASCFRIERTVSAANGRVWGAMSKRVDQAKKEGFFEFRFALAPGPDFPRGSEIGWKFVASQLVTNRRSPPLLKGHPDRPYFLVVDSDGRVTHFDLTDPSQPRIRSVVRDIAFATFRPDSDEVLMIHAEARKVSFWNFRTDTWKTLPIDAQPPQTSFVMASFPQIQDVVMVARVGGILEFRDIRSGNVLKTVYLPEIKARRVREVVFSRDMQRMFVAMGFQDLFLIDVPTGKILQHWSLEDREIAKIALSADGQSLWVLETLPDVPVDVKVHLTLRRIRRFFAPSESAVATSANPPTPPKARDFFGQIP